MPAALNVKRAPSELVRMRSGDLNPPKGLPHQTQLVGAVILGLLVLDVLADHVLISSHPRGEVPSRADNAGQRNCPSRPHTSGRCGPRFDL